MKRNKPIPELQIKQPEKMPGALTTGEKIKKILLILCSVAVTLACVLDILQPEYLRLLLWGGGLLSALWLAVLLMPRLRFRAVFTGGYLVLFAVLLWKYRELVAEGFCYTANDVFRRINAYYDIRLDMYSTQAEQAEAVTAFYLAALQVFAWIYAISAWIPGLRFWGRLLLLLSVCAGLPVGLVPSYWVTGLAAVLLFLGLIPEQRWRALLAPVAGWLIWLGAGALIITPEYYEEHFYKPEQKEKLLEVYEKINTSTFWDDLFEKVETFQREQKEYWENFDLLKAISGGYGSSNGINGGTFQKDGVITFDNVTVLKVTMPEIEQSVYLKGFAAATYTPDGWKEPDKAAAKEYKRLTKQYKQYAQELPQRYLRMLYEQRSTHEDMPEIVFDNTLSAVPSLYRLTMNVDYINAGRQYRYAPYVWESEKKDNGEFVQDLYVRSKKKSKKYEYVFFTADMRGMLDAQENFDGDLLSGHPGWNAFCAFEQAYRAYVYDIYTRLPEGHEQLKAMELASEDASLRKKVNAVVNYLSGYRYTLAPGALPDGEDFVDYFLFENKQGYCVHFASAAVLLLRNMGVPARYAEGYLVTASDIRSAATVGSTLIGGFAGAKYEETSVAQKMVEVKDYSGHAWIEVYCDGFGWVPVEVTYGSTSGATERAEEIDEAVGALPTPTPLPTNTPMPTQTPTPTVAEEVTPIPELTLTPSPTPADTPTPVGRPDTPHPKDTSGITETAPGNTSETGTNKPTSETGQPNRTPDGTNGSVPEGENSGEALQTVRPSTFWERVAELTGGGRILLQLLRVLYVGGLIGGVTALVLYLRYKLVWKWRRESFRSGRRYVLWYYHALERLLAKYGLKQGKHESCLEFQQRVMQECEKIPEVFPEVMGLALKAAFGRERLKQEEQQLVYETYQKMLTRYYKKHSKLYMLYCKIVKLY